MPDKFLGFDWDDANEEHIADHGVHPEEVEEAAGNKPAVFSAKTVKGEKRWKLLGQTDAGRYLTVFFTVRNKLFRTVTAYDMTATDRKTYAAKVR